MSKIKEYLTGIDTIILLAIICAVGCFFSHITVFIIAGVITLLYSAYRIYKYVKKKNAEQWCQ